MSPCAPQVSRLAGTRSSAPSSRATLETWGIAPDSCQTWRMRVLWVAVLVSLVPAPVVHAGCAVPQRHPVVVNDGVRAPNDGGVVVATSNAYLPGSDDNGEAMQPTWVFTHDGTKDKPVAVALAPGLVVYQLPPGVTDADLSDGTAARAHIVAFDTAAKPLAAPAVKTVSHKTWSSPRGSGGLTTVTLSDDLPASAVAMILRDARTKKAMTYGLVEPADARSVVVYTQGRCAALPNGTVAPRAGQRVVVQWVDSFGRISGTSKPLTIAKEP